MSALDLFALAEGLALALTQCGQIALGLQGRVAGEDKAPDSPLQTSTAVSVVDRLCQEVLLLAAHRLAPGIQANSEEMETCPPAIAAFYAGARHRYALILDPLDGSGDYLAGRATYGHMLGLLDQERGSMALGMIYLPGPARLYVGVAPGTGLPGTGAWRATGLLGRWEPLAAPAAPPRTVGRTKRQLPTDEAALAREGYAFAEAESASCAWEAARLLEGALGALVMRHFHGHDTAPAAAIVAALGGAACGPGGAPITYTIEMPRLPLVALATHAGWAREIAHEIARDLTPGHAS